MLAGPVRMFPTLEGEQLHSIDPAHRVIRFSAPAHDDPAPGALHQDQWARVAARARLAPEKVSGGLLHQAPTVGMEDRTATGNPPFSLKAAPLDGTMVSDGLIPAHSTRHSPELRMPTPRRGGIHRIRFLPPTRAGNDRDAVRRWRYRFFSTRCALGPLYGTRSARGPSVSSAEARSLGCVRCKNVPRRPG